MFVGLGRVLILLGLFLVMLGLLVTFLPGARLGRLPGDIVIRRGNWTIYLPVATCILLSALFSALLWLLSVFRK